MNYNIDENYLGFTINKDIYPVNVIMKTAYIFTPHFYIYFDYITDFHIEVKFKPKMDMPLEELHNKAGEFNNELLNQYLRFEIQEKTKEIRQLILGRALYRECIEIKKDRPNLSDISNEVLDIENSEGDYEIDGLNISSNWEESNRFGGTE